MEREGGNPGPSAFITGREKMLVEAASFLGGGGLVRRK